jgi:hypothetical protein
MSKFSVQEAKKVALSIASNADETSLAESFVLLAELMHQEKGIRSGRTKKIKKLDLTQVNDLEFLANKYYESYRKNDFPKMPETIPDKMVSEIMGLVFGHATEVLPRIEVEHQQAMACENCVGNLLERYLDSVLREYGWCWCCGEFVRAIDFICKDSTGEWVLMQIKNRNNSENSSSSAIRSGTTIEKWFRTFSKSSKSRKSNTNWNNLPKPMQGYGLSEDDFNTFAKAYLKANKPK